MSDVWLVIGGLALATLALKAASVLAFTRRSFGRAGLRTIEALTPALLAALIVAESLAGPNGGVHVDARLVGLLAALVVVCLTRSLLLVTAAAVIAAAAARALAGLEG